MKGVLILFISLLCFTAIAQKSEEVFVISDSLELSGTLIIPESEELVSVALIIAGSGPTDRDGNNALNENNSLKMLAMALSEKGIASLRYDKRGVGASSDSTIQESEMRFEDFIEDAKQWVQFLSNDKRFNEIVIVGHSEGSLIGMIAAVDVNVAKYVSIAGPGRPANDVLLDQIIASSPFFTTPATTILDSLANGYTVTSMLPALKPIFRPSVQPYLISWFKYDPAVEIAKLDKPILIIQGTTDIQVPVSEAELLAEAKPKAELVIVEGMNHVLKEAPADRAENIATYSKPDLPLADGFAEAMIDFILK